MVEKMGNKNLLTEVDGYSTKIGVINIKRMKDMKFIY